MPRIETMPRFMTLPLQYHLVAGMFIRCFLISYGNYHDSNYDVQYTDVDYKVFTDAARHVTNGESPYKRHTFRYSPIIAYMLIPNLTYNKNFGKVLFSVFDILLTIAVKKLVEVQLGPWKNKADTSKIAMYCALFWLYNPMTIGIATRGNADSFPCLCIVMALFFLQTNTVDGYWKYVLSGFMLGISIHLRLYPLAFSFPMYLSIGEYKINRKTTLTLGLISLLPNMKQIILTMSCIMTLVMLTVGFYGLYGYEFLFETYLYHFFRKDTRHNFSVLFYHSYLSMDNIGFDYVKIITRVLEFIVLFMLSLTFGPDPQTLPFAMFCQSVVLVAFNSVMTSQYFIWFLSLLSLVIHSFKMPRVNGILLAMLWVSSQMAWLYYAYLIEFKSREVYILLWFKSIILFFSHVYALGTMIKHFSPGFGFGEIESN